MNPNINKPIHLTNIISTLSSHPLTLYPTILYTCFRCEIDTIFYSSTMHHFSIMIYISNIYTHTLSSWTFKYPTMKWTLNTVFIHHLTSLTEISTHMRTVRMKSIKNTPSTTKECYVMTRYLYIFYCAITHLFHFTGDVPSVRIGG